MNNNVELMNLYRTTCGTFPGDGKISHFEFRDRVEAAAAAGFRGIGLWHTDLEHVLVHRNLAEMKEIAVEVFSRELTELSLDEVNTRAFTTTMAQFE